VCREESRRTVAGTTCTKNTCFWADYCCGYSRPVHPEWKRGGATARGGRRGAEAVMRKFKSEKAKGKAAVVQ